MKRVFIIHGWSGRPSEGWFPWLKAELEMRGLSVQVPAMPNADKPTIEEWIPFLSKVVGTPDSETYFVGHSIGCQAIIRYLQTLPAETKIGGAVFVAGWYDVRNLETAEEKKIAAPWVNEPRDDVRIKSIIGGRATAIFSDNDPFVDLINEKHWREKVGAKTIIEKGRGHFNEESDTFELPVALASLLELATEPFISIDEFIKNDLRVGKVLNAERIEGADKLLKLTIDLGEAKPRTICSGVAEYYQPEFLIGKLVVVIVNLAPRMMRGVESQGMVLMASVKGEPPILLSPLSEVPAGSKIK